MHQLRATRATRVSSASLPRPLAIGTLAVLLLAVLPALSFATGATEPAADVFRLATQPIVQTDPAFISSDAEIAVANAVYDYLVDVDHQNRVQPRLARSWEVSNDGRTYTFDLQRNVRFHDGSTFSADDVAWTFDRLRSEDVGAATVSLYGNITSVRATNANTVVFRLSEPNPFFLFDLSDNHALIIKNGTTDATDFNGTGPFRMVNYSAEALVELEANTDYWGGAPSISTFEIVFFPDSAASIDALRSGQVDMVWRMSVAVLKSLEGEPGIRTISVPTNAFDVFRIRADRSPGNDPRVIKAFRMAIDRDEIFDKITLGSGGRSNDSPIGPLYSDYHVPVSFERDVAGARRLLAEAGYSDGLQIDLQTPDTQNRPDFAVLLKEQLADIGVEVNVIVQPESVYYGDGGWLDANFGITGWGSRPNPQFYFDVMLVSGARWNEAHFSDPELDRLAGIAGSTLDEAERKDAYVKLQALLADRGPLIIGYFFAQTGAVNDRFTGIDLKAFAGRTDFSKVVAR